MNRTFLRGSSPSLLGLLLVFGVAASVSAGPPRQVPPDVTAILLIRILAYDRQLPVRAGPTVNIAVVYPPVERAYEYTREQLVTALVHRAERSTVAGRKVRALVIPYSPSKDFESKLARERVVAVYVGPGLEDEIENIAHITQRQKILSFASERDYVMKGLSIGVLRLRDRASILVNLASSHAEGAILDAGLLRIARFIK